MNNNLVRDFVIVILILIPLLGCGPSYEGTMETFLRALQSEDTSTLNEISIHERYMPLLEWKILRYEKFPTQNTNLISDDAEMSEFYFDNRMGFQLSLGRSLESHEYIKAEVIYCYVDLTFQGPVGQALRMKHKATMVRANGKKWIVSNLELIL